MNKITICNKPVHFLEFVKAKAREDYEEALDKARRDTLFSPRFRYFWGNKEVSAEECYERLLDLDYCPEDLTVL